MGKNMYTFKVRLNDSEPLYKPVVVHADTEDVAKKLAIAKITKEWSPAYSPGKDTVRLELISTIS
jgi:hypothetical protein